MIFFFTTILQYKRINSYRFSSFLGRVQKLVNICDLSKIVKNINFIALNDVVVDHGKSGRILKTQINVDDDYLNTYESDGMIISTSIGSTAYSLSAGGPIVHPSMDTIIITPICSHSLSARSIVLSGEKLISLKFPEPYREGISCTVDGQERFLIKDSSKLEIKKSKKYVKVVILPSYNYFDTLRNKMRWSGNLR